MITFQFRDAATGRIAGTRVMPLTTPVSMVDRLCAFYGFDAEVVSVQVPVR
jgi:hypothetical protein